MSDLFRLAIEKRSYFLLLLFERKRRIIAGDFVFHYVEKPTIKWNAERGP